jgi:hypothetical protein
LEGYDIQTHNLPFAVSGQAKAPATTTNDPVPIFEGMPTPEPHHMEESNEQPYSYLQKWYREMDKDFGPTLLGWACFKKGLDDVRQLMIAEAERESKGKRGREHGKDQLNSLDFGSLGLERNKTARRLKPLFEKCKPKK